MPSKTLYPQRVLLRKGKYRVVMVQLHSLESAHPNLTVGEMATALNKTTNQDFEQALKEKTEVKS